MIAVHPSLEKLARAFPAGSADVVFISGSRVQGLGNARSDYDIYVIQHDDARALPFVTLVLDDSYVVYESFSRSHALRVAETVNALSPGDFAGWWALSWFELEFYYRLLTGRGLVNEDGHAELKRHFSKSVIEAAVGVWCGLRSVVHLDEARRKLAIGRRRGAYTSAQQAASAAVDSFLARHGEAYPSFKWRFEKLDRLLGRTHPLFRRAWELKALGTRDVEDYLAAVTAFWAELGMERFRDWSLARVAPRRAEAVHVATVAGVSYLIHNRTSVHELSEAGRRLWERIDGATARGDLIDGAVTDGLMPELEADGFLFELSTYGLIR